MKKIIFSLVGSIFFLFFIWTLLAYKQYGGDLIYHHLNLEGMVSRIKDSWITYSVYDDIKGILDLLDGFEDFTTIGIIRNSIKTFTGVDLSFSNDILQFFSNVLSVLLDPIQTFFFSIGLALYGTYSSIRLLITMLSVLFECLSFVFNPMFI